MTNNEQKIIIFKMSQKKKKENKVHRKKIHKAYKHEKMLNFT